MTILVDINVLLDVFQRRQPFYVHSLAVMNEVMTGSLKGVCPSHGLATLFYLIEKAAATADAETAIDEVLAHFEVVGIHTQEWQKARKLQMTDLEDAGVAITAEVAGASFIVTRNVADFNGSPVAALTPEAFGQRFLPPS